jgi:hypothetical protein
VIVEVPTVAQAFGGGAPERLHQRVSIPRADLLELETRKLDRVRTGALAGAATLVVGTVVIRAIRGDPGKEQLPGGDGGNEVRIPLAGFRW